MYVCMYVHTYTPHTHTHHTTHTPHTHHTHIHTHIIHTHTHILYIHTHIHTCLTRNIPPLTYCGLNSQILYLIFLYMYNL